jgi:hypothetical protein
MTIYEEHFPEFQKYATDARTPIPAGQGYYHAFENGKLCQRTTFFFEEELEAYRKDYPDRTLEKQEGEQVHKLLIGLSKDHEAVSQEYSAGYWLITEHKYQEMIDKIPTLGTSGGWPGRTGLRMYEGHFEAFKQYARDARQQTLF